MPLICQYVHRRAMLKEIGQISAQDKLPAAQAAILWRAAAKPG